MRRENVLGHGTARWHSFSGVPRGCVNKIRLWSLRRDDHSGVLIGAGGTRRSDWPARVLANDVSTRTDRLHACREKWQLDACATLKKIFHLEREIMKAGRASCTQLVTANAPPLKSIMMVADIALLLVLAFFSCNSFQLE